MLGYAFEKEIQIEILEKGPSSPFLDLPGSTSGSMGVMNLSDIFGKNFGSFKKKKPGGAPRAIARSAWLRLARGSAPASRPLLLRSSILFLGNVAELR